MAGTREGIELTDENIGIFGRQVLSVLSSNALTQGIALEPLVSGCSNFVAIVDKLCGQETKKFHDELYKAVENKKSVALERAPIQNAHQGIARATQYQLSIDSSTFGAESDYFRQEITLWNGKIAELNYALNKASLYLFIPHTDSHNIHLCQIELNVSSSVQKPINKIVIVNESILSIRVAKIPDKSSLHIYSKDSDVEMHCFGDYSFNELVLVSKNNYLLEGSKFTVEKALILAKEKNLLQMGVGFTGVVDFINLLSRSLDSYVGAINENTLPEPSFRMLNISHANSGLIDQVQQLSVVNVNAISCFANNRPTGLPDSFSAQEESLGTSMINKPSVSCGALLFGTGVLLLAASAFYMYKEKNIFVATALACGSIVFGCIGVSIFAGLNCALILLDKLNLRNFSIDSSSAAYMLLTQLDSDNTHLTQHDSVDPLAQCLMSQKEAQHKGKGAVSWCSWLSGRGDEASGRENSLDPSSIHSAGSVTSLLYRSDSQDSLYRGESNESPRDGQESKAYASDVCEV